MCSSMMVHLFLLFAPPQLKISVLKHGGPHIQGLYDAVHSFRTLQFQTGADVHRLCHRLLFPILAGSLRGLSLRSEPAGRPGGRRM